jgi:dTMP kinase
MTALDKAMKRGAFIVFEGCDRSGKSTQAKRLIQRLKTVDHDAQLLRFPGKHRASR